ncbi:MAG: hypothetical protein H6Q14_1092 [Bacteroidetes bacterium]|nr:hypothetical protein [Bacteroidota bacterium]
MYLVYFSHSCKAICFGRFGFKKGVDPRLAGYCFSLTGYVLCKNIFGVCLMVCCLSLLGDVLCFIGYMIWQYIYILCV